MKKAIVIGAGPAGLTAAYELLNRNSGYEVTVLEESNDFGGISKTVSWHGNRMDMGGHRFFSKVPEVNEWWEKMLPLQGSPTKDDIMLGRQMPLKKGGPDPEKTDVVMLRRHRVSRIFFDKKFFDYPISLKLKTLQTLGLATTIKVGFSYIKAVLFKKEETNLENFYINRFGKKLYSMFFENYTENLWGRHPSEIDASWGAQRVKGLSIVAVIKDVLGKAFGKKNRKVETSLIEEFSYPKLGPGQLWDVTAKKVSELGGNILKNSKVVKIIKDGDRLTGVVYTDPEGKEHELSGDVIISSMPIKDLVAGMNDVPSDPARIAAGLPYRDYMTLGVLIPRKNLLLKNETQMKTVSNIIPDCWIYVQDRSVKMGRFQIYNNWSPYMIKDLENTVWMGLEYFVNEGDRYWNLEDSKFARGAVKEMVKLGIIDDPACVLDTHVERVKKAYPAYFDTYDEIDTLVDWLKGIENLYCVGRNGQHRYNNIDHSMCTSFEAVNNIMSGRKNKDNVWSVNTEKDYHEAQEKPEDNEMD
ncbi:MAG: NAD(P)/FAD-dependent oxidoreductase [Lachnospiraceae bacterium]|nr:NAD(P)/FAD-dependent oxidoreductase [Lachnospiraceae bacterium]